MATIMTPNHRPQMATVRPKVFKRKAGVAGGRAEVTREVLDLVPPRTRIANVNRNPDAVDIAAAKCEACEKRFGSPCTRFCPAEVYRREEGGIRVDFSNCLHCKTCKIKCPCENIEWTFPQGGDGPCCTCLHFVSGDAAKARWAA